MGGSPASALAHCEAMKEGDIGADWGRGGGRGGRLAATGHDNRAVATYRPVQTAHLFCDSTQAQAQVVLYCSGRHMDRLAVGLREWRPGRVVLWDNSSPADLAIGEEHRPGVGDWTWLSSDAGNLGFGRAHNRLAATAPAPCKYLLFLNPDAVPEFDCLQRLVAKAEANPRAALIEAAQFPIEHPKGYDPETGETNWCSGACLLVRRAAFDELGGFDPAFFLYCEDVDLSWRAWLAGWQCLYVPDARCLHVTEGEDVGKDRTTEVFHSHLSQLYLRRKHFGEQAMQDYLGAMRERLSPRFVDRVLGQLAPLPEATGYPADNPHIVLTPGEAYGPRRW
jgi:GT2 family glycosyltransferase